MFFLHSIQYLGSKPRNWLAGIALIPIIFKPYNLPALTHHPLFKKKKKKKKKKKLCREKFLFFLKKKFKKKKIPQN